jgi:hypothetical protein
METIDIKNKLSTVAGILTGLAGLDLTLTAALAPYGVSLPIWFHITCGILGSLGITLMGLLQGRNADGSKKTIEQVQAQLNARKNQTTVENKG